MERGVTQGDLVSLTNFNIAVDAAVREVILEVCVTQEAHHGFCWLEVNHNIFFYEYDECVAGREPI